MSNAPSNKHQPDPERAGATPSSPPCVRNLAEHAPEVASQLDACWDDIPLTTRLLEQLLVSDEVLSLPPRITSHLLRLYEYYVRNRPADAPSTTWELPASGFRDLYPSATTCEGNT